MEQGLQRRQDRTARVISWSCSVALLLMALACVAPLIIPGRQLDRHPTALSNAKCVALGIAMYSNDNDDRYPLAKTWMEAIHKNVRGDQFLLPKEQLQFGTGAYEWAFRRSLSGRHREMWTDNSPTSETAMVFDSSLGTRNATSELDTMPATPRYYGGDYVAFTDCHTRWIAVANRIKLK